MQRLTARALMFGSFVKLIVAAHVGLGSALGVLAFVASLLGASVSADVLGTQLSGVPAGAAALVLVPILSAVFGGVLALLGYLPFRVLVRCLGGIDLEIDPDRE